MMKRVLTEVVGILFIYAIYAIAVVLFYDVDISAPENWPIWPLVVWAGSFLAMAIWYVLASVVIAPQQPLRVWAGVWLLLLSLVIIGAAAATYVEDFYQTDTFQPNPWLHFVGGVGAYYLASLLFSPLFAKYVVWPARFVRKW